METQLQDDESLESEGIDFDLLSLESEGIDSDQSDEDELFPRHRQVYIHELIEVFSVRFIDHSNRYISGNIRIELYEGDYYLFQTNKADSHVSSIEIDSQGYAILTPDWQCPLDIPHYTMFYSHFEKLKGEVEGLRTLGRKKQKRMNKKKRMDLPLWDNRFERKGQILWNMFVDRSGNLTCRQVMTQVGPVEIMYAIFYDAVEALVDITLSNWRLGQLVEDPIKLYGKVTAKNSLIQSSQAKSILFQRDIDQAVCVHPTSVCMGDIISLPLLRRRVVLPRRAAIQIYIDIWQCLTDDTEAKIIANDKVQVTPQPSHRSDRVIRTEDFMVIRAEGFDIQVKIKWLHDFCVK